MEFSVESMILSVERRPELWDTSSESYKDRYNKREGWTQVCCEVFSGFEEKAKADQLTCEKAVITKWRTVRDGYVKGKKKEQEGFRSGKAAKRTHPYIYAEHLRFLDKVIQMRETDETLATSENGPRDIEVVGDNSEQQISREQNPNDEQRVHRESHARKQQASRRKSNVDSQFEKYSNASALMRRRVALEDDDNLSFFKSLIPTVRQLNPSQLFDFRIQTMQNLQRILFSNPSQSQSTHYPAVFHPQPAPHTSYYMPPSRPLQYSHFSTPTRRRKSPSFRRYQQDDTQVSAQLSANSASTDSDCATPYDDEGPIEEILNF